MKNGFESELKRYIDVIYGKQIIGLVALDVRGLTSVADAFLICSGRSHRHVSAIAEHIRLWSSMCFMNRSGRFTIWRDFGPMHPDSKLRI